MSKLLPDQYGVILINTNFEFSDDPFSDADKQLHQEYLDTWHILYGDLTPFIQLYRTNPPTKSRMIFMIRNWLMDTIKDYYRSVSPNSPFDKVKQYYLKRGPQAYNFLKSDEFLSKLKDFNSLAKPPILITSDIWEQIEYTFSEANKLILK